MNVFACAAHCTTIDVDEATLAISAQILTWRSAPAIPLLQAKEKTPTYTPGQRRGWQRHISPYSSPEVKFSRSSAPGSVPLFSSCCRPVLHSLCAGDMKRHVQWRCREQARLPPRACRSDSRCCGRSSQAAGNRRGQLRAHSRKPQLQFSLPPVHCGPAAGEDGFHLQWPSIIHFIPGLSHNVGIHQR